MNQNPSDPPRKSLNRTLSLPRLPREYYQADAVVHWTLATFDRVQGWLTPALHSEFRELMFHTAAREGVICPVYCLMPDFWKIYGVLRQSDANNIKRQPIGHST